MGTEMEESGFSGIFTIPGVNAIVVCLYKNIVWDFTPRKQNYIMTVKDNKEAKFGRKQTYIE